jgi:uncharacterized membrane protein
VAAESLVFVGQFMQSRALIAVGWLVYLALLVGVLVRWYFAFFLIVDRDLSVFGALSASWRMTEGKAWKTVGLTLLATLVAMSGILACGVGVIFTVMLSYLMFASAYRQMAGPRLS